MAVKDQVGFVTGVLALIISLGSIAYNVLQQEDDLTAIVQGEVHLRPEEEAQGKLVTALWSDQKITIVNAGTRPVGIPAIKLEFGIPVSNSGLRDCHAPILWYEVPYSLDPVVFKSDDIFSKRVGIEEIPGAMTQDKYNKIPVPDKPVDRYQFLICISFDVALPDMFRPDVRFPLYNGETRRKGNPLVEGKQLWDEHVPFVIVRRWGTISQVLSRVVSAAHSPGGSESR